MLAIRLQRTGRKGHAQFRILVQDSRRTPTSGRFVYLLGNYDPHSKAINLDKEKAEYYLANGARPSDRVARLLQKEGIKLPSWVQLEAKQSAKTRHPEKLRKNQPAEAPAPAEAPVEAPAQPEEAPAPAEEAAPAE
jgi:small subunit ribosomal protein S16